LAAVDDAEIADLAETPIAQRMFWIAACKAAARDGIAIESNGFPPGLGRLVHPTYWRSQLLALAPGDDETMALADLPQAERDRLGAMMADVMLLALKPWFDGRAQLKQRHGRIAK
jgi:hypothetical protein